MATTELDLQTDSQAHVTGVGRLYGGDAPATGEAARFSLDREALAITAETRAYTVPLAALRVRKLDSTLRGLELSWQADDTSHALHVFEGAALAALRAHPHLGALPQMAALRAVERRTRAIRLLGWSALGLFLALPLLLILTFVWQSDRIAAAVAARISIEQETRFGEQAFAAMRDSLRFQDSGPAHEAVQTLGERLTQGSAYTYRFHVVEDPAVNAFAVPGGIIVVHSGLIAATRRPEELAGVLAHEVQHVELRHSLTAMVKQLGLVGLWSVLSGDPSNGLIGRAAIELTSLSFSRSAEAEADAKGVELLVDRGIDPSGMADFFITLAEREGETVPPAWLSTHPASRAREAMLGERVAELGHREFAPLPQEAWPPALR